MKKKLFIFLLLFIAFFGLSLRLIDYDSVPPFGETMDEFHYAWAGLTWITEGTPRTWSWLNSYTNPKFVDSLSIGTFRLVSPELEKPPLYMWISGGWMFLMGARDIFEVRLSSLRILPILISFFTIIGVGILARNIFSKRVGIIAALLYAIVPTIVLTNRLSLIENFLTPLVILTLIVLQRTQIDSHKFLKVFIVGILSGLVIMTKQTGIALALVCMGFYVFQRKWQSLFILIFLSLVGLAVFPLIGLYYNFELFIKLAHELQQMHTYSALPEFVFSLFRNPVIACIDCYFIDGTMFLGYILLLSAPLWIQFDKQQMVHDAMSRKILLLGFPFVYLTLMATIFNGANDFYGWYVYPLFPFSMILIAKLFVDIYEQFSISKLLVVILTVGLLMVRLFLLMFPYKFISMWQTLFIWLLLFTGLAWVIRKKAHRKYILIFLLIIFIFINVLVDLDLGHVYKSLAQPI